MPSISQLITTDITSSNLIAAQAPQGFIADFVAPPLPVPRKTAKLGAIDSTAETWRLRNVIRPVGGEADKMTWDFTRPVTYDCDDYALDSVVPVEAMMTDFEAMNKIQTYAEKLAENIRVNIEKKVYDLVVATCTGSTTTSVAAGDRFDTGTSNPVAYLRNKLSAVELLCGRRPTKAAFGRKVMDGIINSAAFNDVGGKYSTDVMRQSEAAAKLAAMLDLEEVQIGRSIYNAALPGATPSNTRIWGTSALLFYAEPPSELSGNVFSQPAWQSGDESPTGEGGLTPEGWRVKYWYEPVNNSWHVRVSTYRDLLAHYTAGNTLMCAHLLTSCVA